MLLLLLLLTGVVGTVVIYIASMNRREISNQCVLCFERMTYKSIHNNFRKIKNSKHRPCFSVGQFIDTLVTHKSTVARTVMCRQDGRGRFPVLLDDHSKCRTNSQRKSQLS